MTTPLALIALDALPQGRGRRVCKAGLDLALFRVGDAVFAIDDSCPHAGGSLANGKLQGTRVACPAHGLKFELDPARAADPAALQVRKYAVWVSDGMLMLDPGSCGQPPAGE